MSEPFLRWVGGKRQLVPELIKHIPTWSGDYYEPFIGGGALFFALKSATPCVRGHLNDSNPHLVNVYQQVRDRVDIVLGALAEWDSTCQASGLAGAYKECRDSFNLQVNSLAPSLEIVRAAQFIAMNAWGFNGLCRYNRKGGFNVPCGKFSKTPVLMSKVDNLRAVSKALRCTQITCGDFAKAVEKAKKGDLVYFDPPYIPMSATADFTSYTKGGFDIDDQRRLCSTALALICRGVHVVLSNSDTPTTRALYNYEHFELHKVQARRAINCKAEKRGEVGELVIVGGV